MISRRPTLLASTLASTLALGLLAGCSSSPRPASEAPSAESGGTPPSRVAAPAEAPPPPAAPMDDRSGGTAAAADKPTVYVVQDSGMRCIAAPCPSLVARPAEGPPDAEGIPITDLDLSALGLSDEQKERVMANAQKGGPGLKVEASVVTRAKAGPAGAATVLRVNRVLEGK